VAARLIIERIINITAVMIIVTINFFIENVGIAINFLVNKYEVKSFTSFYKIIKNCLSAGFRLSQISFFSTIFTLLSLLIKLLLWIKKKFI